MGADIKSLRNRIKSVDSTLHLTKAMGLVASSKIRRATDGMNKGREYLKAVNKTIKLLTTCNECAKSPYMQVRETNRTKIIVIAGDRGLAGGYNANIFRLARDYSDAIMLPIGKRACDRFGEGALSSEKYGYSDAIELSKELCTEFSEGKFDKLGILSTEYISVMTQNAKIEWILPLQKDTSKGSAGVIFEPDALSVLDSAVPEYVAGVIISAVRESFASEVAARRTAMDSAGKNAEEMIDGLTLEYNRARQGTITQEITEIVAGSGI